MTHSDDEKIELENWRSEDTPWNLVKEMGTLTYLIYDYAKNWEIKNFDKLDKFFSNQEDNENLCENDIKLLQQLKEKYPEGEVLKFFTNDADLQCVIGKNPHKNRYTIVFRGSEGFWDWMYDLLIIKTKLKDNIYVHKGFHRQLTYNNTFDKIKDFVGNCIKENPDWEWCINGHSLGSSLSTLSGYLLAKEFPHIKWTVVALASPRVGDKNFKEDFEKTLNLRLYRVSNHRDSVTAVPMWRYYHVGRCLHFDSSKNSWNDFGFFPSIAFNMFRCWNPFDHSCTHYIKHLEFCTNGKCINHCKK